MKIFISLLILTLSPTVFAETSCRPSEIFTQFYAQFKTDSQFQLQRTTFPVKKTVFVNEQPRVSYISKQSVLNKEEYLYLDQTIMADSGYIELIKDKTSSEIKVLIGSEGSEPLVSYIFQNTTGCWSLTEYEE
ncbi:MAG: DUF4348 domain-containing protein [Methylococcaceae bacterium]|nr:DUF4348 domain-containing protein [Methylococcaceae bacterium]